MTHNYIGTKEIVAWPQESGPSHADPLGLLPKKPGYAVKYAPDGYTSWSPKDVFEAAYRVAEGPSQSLTFGDAIHFLNQGKRVARTGWNGKGMFLFLNKGSSALLRPRTEVREYIGGVSERLFELGAGGTATRMPNLNMRAADGSTVTGWLASQTDMLAEDWCVLSPVENERKGEILTEDPGHGAAEPVLEKRGTEAVSGMLYDEREASIALVQAARLKAPKGGTFTRLDFYASHPHHEYRLDWVWAAGA